MDLNLLEDFLCLSDQRSFSRAAEIRHVTQSTLSKRIRALEHWIGAELVDRSNCPVTLTSEGAALVPQARDLVTQIGGMRAGIRAFATPARDAVSFSALHTLKLKFLPALRRRLAARIGPLTEEPSTANAAFSQTVRDFRNGNTDFLLSYVHPAVGFPFEPGEVDCVTLGHERVVPLSAPGPDGRPLHPLETGRVVRFLSYGTESFFAQALAHLLNARPMALNVVATNPMCIGLMSMAQVGSGVAWIPESLAREQIASGELVPAGGTDWTLDVDIALFRRRARARPVVDRIWQAVLEAAAADVHPLHPPGIESAARVRHAAT